MQTPAYNQHHVQRKTQACLKKRFSRRLLKIIERRAEEKNRAYTNEGSPKPDRQWTSEQLALPL